MNSFSWSNLNPFSKARLKLTIWYLVIYCSLIGFFSYLTLDARDAAYVRVYRVIDGAAPGSQEVQEFSDTYNELNDTFKERLFLFDTFLVLLGALLAWWLSGKTLAPVKQLHDAEQAFVGDVSHSLRTPLTTLTMMITAYERTQSKLPKHTQQFIESIQEEVLHLRRLIEGLLSMARAQHNVMKVGYEKVEVNQLLTHCQELMVELAMAKDQKIMVIAHSPAYVLADYDQIKQVLLVLLDNAIKYGSAGNLITMSLIGQDSLVRITVSDQGPGIDQKDIKHLFKRYARGSTLKNTTKGTGLGLAIAKAIIETHGGKIRVKSSLGKGTDVYIYLPKA